MLTLVLIVVATALVFEYINGFHDTANSIATVVATKVLTPLQAVGLAASMNLIGALMGTAVAKTISSGLIDAGVIDVGSQLILCALLGGIIWNLITWWFGLPSSSSHALIGGLIGAALAGEVLVLRWLDAVREAAARLGRGDLSVRAPLPPGGELRELASAFNDMADSVEASQAQQRELVADAVPMFEFAVRTTLDRFDLA